MTRMSNMKRVAARPVLCSVACLALTIAPVQAQTLAELAMPAQVLTSTQAVTPAQAVTPGTNFVAAPAVGTATYHGGYLQLLYFLSGEHDNYNKGTGVFDRVIPHENFGWFRKCGAGAWQVGARYNYLDLNDDGLDGGILHNGTFGLNWFLNPNMKIQFDTMATHRDAPFAGDLGDGWIYGFGIRFAQDF